MILLDGHPLRSLLLALRRRRNDPTPSTILTYRCSNEKPAIFSYKRFELFYKSRPLVVFLQVITAVGVILWTIQNYIRVIHSL